MKNNLIQALGSLFKEATSSTLDVKDAYKVFKWKTELLKANRAIEEKREALIKETFTEEELKVVNSEDPKSEELKEKINNFNKLFFELMEDESSLDIKTVSYESWHNFLKENSIKLGFIECELEGVLFKAPEE